MLSLKLFFVGLLVCSALAVGGSSRTLRLASRRFAKTGEARNTASSAALQTSSTSASTRGTEEIVEVPELDHRKTSSLLRSREGGRLSSLLSRGNVDSLSITRNTSRSHVVLLSEDPARTTKSRSIDGKNIVTNLRKSKPNSTFTPELNSLDASVKERKPISRSQKLRDRERMKPSGRFRTRRVTKELREFWERLDQRELTNRTDNRTDTAESGKVNSNLSKTLPETNGTELNNTVFEEFPFLSENYDYNYYYYEDEVMHNNTTSSQSLENQVNKTNQVTTAPTEHLVQEPSANNRENSRNINFQRSNSNENTSSITMSHSRESLSKKLSDNMLLVPKIQARMMPELTALGSRRITQVSAEPPSIPVTASDSFRSRRLNDNERDANRPRDILKEFPIFRQLNKNQTVEENKRKTLSLHERLLHLRSRQPIVSTTSSMPTTIGTTPAATYTETSTSTTTTRAVQSTTPLSTTTSTNIEIISMSQDLPRTSSVHRKTLEIRLLDAEQFTNLTVQEQLDVTLKNSTESSNSTQQIHRNVTFSTSKTHKVAQTSPSFIVANPIVLESQLGIAPLGEAPFGVAPFGDIPMGEKPFGLLPEGISPLGNQTSEENTTDTSATPGEGVDGRYHVQVTGPDGSINGDYIVVDPVTGDVNGVRYEAAHDVDPLLVQRALLNFLNLDPRLSPIGTSTANVEEILDDSTNPPETTEADVVVTDASVAAIEVLENTTHPEIGLKTGPSEITESPLVEPLPYQSSPLIQELAEPTVTPGAPIVEPTEPPEMTFTLVE